MNVVQEYYQYHINIAIYRCFEPNRIFETCEISKRPVKALDKRHFIFVFLMNNPTRKPFSKNSLFYGNNLYVVEFFKRNQNFQNQCDELTEFERSLVITLSYLLSYYFFKR